MSADSAVSIAWDVFKIVFVPIKHQFEYVMCSKKYADSLRKEVGNLEYEATRVRDAKELARNNLQNIHAWVPEFLANAEKALKEAGDLLGEFDKASKTCCRGPFPVPNCRYPFSREAKHRTDDISNLIRENRDREVSFSGPATGNVAAPTSPWIEGKDVVQSTTASASTSTKLRDDGVFESRASVIQQIMDALADDTKSVVGIHGMGGVGKSTLLLDVEKRIWEERSFDLVTKADVSENPDIKRIQGEIADALSLSDIQKKESISGRAELLRRRLEKEEREKKKVLIILDNLWETLDLETVGIPCEPGNKARGCKLLLTARDLNVLLKEMHCKSDSAFLLGKLENEEAKRLFEKRVGDKLPVELEPLVEKALRICAGLPFLIIQIAKLFIHTSYSDCEDDLKQIWNEETGDVINKTLQLSYGRISDEAKSLLRLCVAYGVSKPSLERLARYSFGLGIFRGVSSMQEARDRLRRLIHALQASSLLLEGDEDADGFKIHDLVRKFVASFASTEHPILVFKDKDKSVTEVSEDKLKSCEAICFPYVDLEELPKELVCPELRIFLLFRNIKSLEIPDSYFNSMKNLMALDLTGIRLNCSPLPSPSPFQFLEKLHSLCLDYCSVEDVAILGKLKGLQILSLRNSDIQRLPKEIGQLTELKLLDLNHCSQLQIIEPGVLGSLAKLEELYMECSFDQWSATEQTPPTKASLIELNNMKKLRTLYVSIRDSSVLPKDLDVEKLTKHRIKIGDVQHWFWSEYEGSRMLELKLDSTSDILQKECIRSILCKIDDMLLDGLNRTEQSIYQLSVEGFPKLKHLKVNNSPSIRYILERSSLFAFNVLETLLLKNMINLEKITKNNISTESFNALKVVRVESCDKMQVLFPRSVVRELSRLEEIKVKGCKLMRGIVEADDDRGKFELPNLRVLELRDLPNIENFFTVGSSPSSSTSNDQVGAQITFFNGQQVAFPKLESLEINCCHNVGFMFFPSMVKSLTQLRKLSIRDCDKMEAIILEEEELGVEILETLAFPMLTDLCLEDLESLVCFSREKCSREGRSQDHVQLHSSVLFNREVAFPRLEKLEIDGLDNLRFSFSPSIVKSLTELRKLSVSYCKKMEAILMEEEDLGVEISETLAFPMLTDLRLEGLESLACFSRGKCSREGRSQDHVQLYSSVLFNREVALPRLETLEIGGLNNLRFTFFASMVKSHAQLRKLSVCKCKKMEAIFLEEEELGVEISKTLAFPMLTDLRLEFLESLACFSCRKCSREGRSQDHVQLHSSVIFNREVAFPKLETLKIVGFYNHRFTFFTSMVESLTQLRKLSIQLCMKMEAIFMEEEELGVEISKTLAFPMLIDLCLENLGSLACFSCGKCSRGGQSPGGIQSHSSALFNREVAFPRLETLEINGLDNLKFSFFPSMVKSLTQLRNLSVRNCKKMEAIFMEEEELGVEISETLAFPMLTDLCLKNLESLACFSHGKCSREGWTQDHVQLHSSVLFNREVALPRLETLEIDGLDNLRFTFFASMVKSHTTEKTKCVQMQEDRGSLCGGGRIGSGNIRNSSIPDVN